MPLWSHLRILARAMPGRVAFKQPQPPASPRVSEGCVLGMCTRVPSKRRYPPGGIKRQCRQVILTNAALVLGEGALYNALHFGPMRVDIAQLVGKFACSPGLGNT